MADIVFEIGVDKGAAVAEGHVPVVVEMAYERVLDAGKDDGRSSRVTTRVRLDDMLAGRGVLKDAVPGRGVSVAILAVDGTVAWTREIQGSDKEPWRVALSRDDVATILEARQRLPARVRRRTKRAVRFVQSSLAPVDYVASRVYYAVVEGVKAWQVLGLSKLFGTKERASASLEWIGSGWDEINQVDWQRAKVSVDGRFDVQFGETDDVILLWWLQGPLAAVGVVAPDLLGRAAYDESIAATLPPFSLAPAASPPPATTDCKRPPGPMDANETELADNPGVYREDAGSECRPFSAPERVLSERAFYSIVRAEQPAVDSVSAILLSESPIGRPSGHGPAYVGVPDSGRADLDSLHPLCWEAPIATKQATTVARGHILEHRVRWRSNGYSLGTVAKTLTLAPRQVKRIQKIEWQRHEAGRRTEATQQADAEKDGVLHERDYDDSVQASLNEWSFGASAAAAAGAAGGIGFLASGVLGGMGAAAGGAGSVAYQQSGRTTAAREEQQLRDSIRRYADSSRRFNSLVVTEVNQDEAVTGTTEVLRNFNYAHSLTVIYYQILRHIRVETELAGVSECLFVPFAMFPFTTQRANRWRAFLERYLKLPRYRNAIAYLPDVASDFATSNIPPGPRANQLVRQLRGSVYIDLAIERPHDPDESANAVDEAGRTVFDSSAWKVLSPILGVPARAVHANLVRVTAAERDRLYQSTYASGIAANWCDKLVLEIQGVTNVDFTLATSYGYRRTVRVDFTAAVAVGVQRDALTRLTVRAGCDLPPGSVANLTSMTLVYDTDDYQYSLRDGSGARDLVRVENGAVDPNGAKAWFPLTAWEKVDRRKELQRAVQDLVDHLNDHVEYYHKAIWWSMDRDRLFMMLDGFTIPGTNGVSIASVVEREPVGVIGNSLVYRVSGGAFLGLGKIEDANALFDLYAGDGRPPAPMHVSLPTDGLYAQSIMDPCGALEEHYGNTDWPLAQPEIDPGTLAPESFGSRRSNPDQTLEPSKMPATLINLQNAPAAPAPSGLQGVLDAVTKGDSFRDITGLAGNQANALAALQAASALATNFGNQAAALEMAKLANRVHATNTADQQLARIDNSKQKGDLSDSDASKLKKKVIEAGIPGAEETGGPLLDIPLKDFADKAAATSGSTLEYKTKDGEFRAEIGSAGDAPPAAGTTGRNSLVELAEDSIDRGLNILARWGAGTDGAVGKTFQQVLTEEAQKQILELGQNAAQDLVSAAVPCGGALVEAFKIGMAFATGMGEALGPNNDELARIYDMTTGTVGSTDLTDLDEQTANGIVHLGRHELDALHVMSKLVTAGLESAIAKAADDLEDRIGKILTLNRDALLKQLASESELLAVLDGIAGKAIEQNEILAKIFSYVFRAFVRQLRKGPFKTALETAIKPLRGFSNVVSEIVAGLCMVVLDLEAGKIGAELSGFVPDVRAMVMAEITYWLGLGPLTIVPAAPGKPIAIKADRLELPAGLAAELGAAPPPARLPRTEMTAAVDAFVNVVQGLQLRVQRKAYLEAERARDADDGLAYRAAARAIDDASRSELRRAQTAYERLEALLRELALRAGIDRYADATQLRTLERELGCPKYFYGVRWAVPDDGSAPGSDPEIVPFSLAR